MIRKTTAPVRNVISTGIPGVINSAALYRCDEFKARMGWRDAAFRAACRKGLRTYRVGKRVFVTGADAMAFIEGEGGAA